MNYLSHLFFSQRTPLSLTGNLMGDFKRQKNNTPMPDSILNGIKNHRFVDKCTDQSAAVKQLRRIFSPQRRRFAGIISDITFDYFLIKHWAQFENTPFDLFVDHSYDGLLQCLEYMPEKMQQVITLMCDNDWLRTYASLDGIETTLDQVAARIRFKNDMSGAIEEVTHNYNAFEEVFLVLFPQLQRQVSEAAIEVLN